MKSCFRLVIEVAFFSKRTNRILRLNPVNGYLAHVTKIGGRQGVCKCLKIHQLVAKAFKENPNNYPVVNHIDGDKFNNCEDNLEWVTISGNVQHAFREGLIDVLFSTTAADTATFFAGLAISYLPYFNLIVTRV